MLGYVNLDLLTLDNDLVGRHALPGRWAHDLPGDHFELCVTISWCPSGSLNRTAGRLSGMSATLSNMVA